MTDKEVIAYSMGKKQGGGGTTDYEALNNKPSINGVTLSGAQSAEDLGLQNAMNMQAKQVTPSNSTQVVTADEGYILGSVTVNAIDEIPNLSPENIKQGVHILDMVGTFNSFPENPSGGLYFSDDDENGYPTKCRIVNWKPAGAFPLTFVYSAFNYLEEVEFINSNGITYFNNSAFYGMTALKKVTLPSSIVKISDGLFTGCVNLTSVNIPSSVTLISGAGMYYPFYQCSSLEFVTLETGFNCNGLVISSSTKYSVETMVAMFNALADRTGETTYTLTLGTTNLNKLTTAQIEIATDKNWTLA